MNKFFLLILKKNIVTALQNAGILNANNCIVGKCIKMNNERATNCLLADVISRYILLILNAEFNPPSVKWERVF